MRVGRLVRAPEFDPLEVRSFCCLRALAGAGGEIRPAWKEQFRMCTSTRDTQSIASQHLAEDACPDLQVPTRRASDVDSRVTFTWFLEGFAGGPSIRDSCDASEWRSKYGEQIRCELPLWLQLRNSAWSRRRSSGDTASRRSHPQARFPEWTVKRRRVKGAKGSKVSQEPRSPTGRS